MKYFSWSVSPLPCNICPLYCNVRFRGGYYLLLGRDHDAASRLELHYQGLELLSFLLAAAEAVAVDDCFLAAEYIGIEEDCLLLLLLFLDWSWWWTIFEVPLQLKGLFSKKLSTMFDGGLTSAAVRSSTNSMWLPVKIKFKNG